MKAHTTLVCLAMAGCLGAAHAHDFWVDGANGDQQFNAHIGYGHDFPKPEPIPQGRVKLFNPLYVVSKDGSKTTLTQSGENFRFSGKKLGTGSYVLAGEYKPTFWSKDSDGKWHMDGTRRNTRNVESCELAVMTAKSMVSVNGAAPDTFLNQPIGQSIEIVPVGNPFDVHVDKPFKLQVFMDGKPLKMAKLTGTFEGFPQDRHAFSGTTDLQGVIEVVALRPGKWMFEVTREQPHKDPAVCEQEILLATLTLQVK